MDPLSPLRMKRSRPRLLRKEEDSWEFLREQAENVLLSNLRAAKTLSTDALPENGTFFPIPCRQADTVQDSTSTLLAARAYAKAGHSTLAWQAIESLLSSQSTSGFVPKYRFTNDSTHRYYINHTDIPSYKLFQNFTNDLYSPPSVHTSGRIAALPFHASFILDVFFLSNQTKMDILHLKRNYDILFQHHNVIHSIVMRGCHDNINNNNNNNNDTTTNKVPCYNVLHPWQTLIPDVSANAPFWNTALSQVKSMMDGWNPPVSSEYHDDASVFLLQCIQNATRRSCHSTRACEDAMLASCPFAMLDVGFAAALDQSNHDLSNMATILHDLRAMPSMSTFEFDKQMQKIKSWKEQSRNVLDALLWNEEYQTYLSRFVEFQQDNKTFVPESTKWLTHAVVSNFMSLWTTLNETRRNRMTFHMMQHSGQFAFDCGDYPLWSMGGCNHSSSTDTTISPMVNYLISKGLRRNHANDISYYLANSTLNLMCGFPNTLVHDNDTASLCRNHTLFWNDYHADTAMPVSRHPVCGETAVAAAMYNVLVEDVPFSYTPAPPIGSRWVLAIVLCELFVAFCIGVSCCLLNLGLFRRLNHNADGFANGEERGGLFRSLSDGADMQYFSAAASLEEANDSDGGDHGNDSI